MFYVPFSGKMDVLKFAFVRYLKRVHFVDSDAPVEKKFEVVEIILEWNMFQTSWQKKLMVHIVLLHNEELVKNN